VPAGLIENGLVRLRACFSRCFSSVFVVMFFLLTQIVGTGVWCVVHVCRVGDQGAPGCDASDGRHSSI